MYVAQVKRIFNTCSHFRMRIFRIVESCALQSQQWSLSFIKFFEKFVIAMFPELRFQLLLLACISMKVKAKIELDINDEKQPLVLAITKSGEHFFALPPILDTDNSSKLTFELEGHQLISACPASDQENYKLGILVLNKNGATTCEKPLKPSTMYEASIKCGVDGTGNYYKVGYMVYYVDATLNEQGIVRDVWLYDLCYSQHYGTLFTMHELHPGMNSKSFEDWKMDNKDYKISSGFVAEQRSNNLNEGSSNRNEIQLVSFDDMIAMPWKTPTLFDFNFHPSNPHISECWEKINQFLREVVNENLIHLDVFNGVKNYSTQISHQSSASAQAAFYYWKVIQCQNEGIALVIADEIPNPYAPPCESMCHKANLRLLEKDIPDLLCCEITESLTEMFDIIMHSEAGPLGIHLNIDKLMVFNDDEFNLDIFKFGRQFYHSIMSLFKTKKE